MLLTFGPLIGMYCSIFPRRLMSNISRRLIIFCQLFSAITAPQVSCLETHHRNAIEAEEASLGQPFGGAGLSLWQVFQ